VGIIGAGATIADFGFDGVLGGFSAIAADAALSVVDAL
jgi:hypothetical protein